MLNSGLNFPGTYYLTNKNFGEKKLEITKDTGSSYLSFLPHLMSWPWVMRSLRYQKEWGEKKVYVQSTNKGREGGQAINHFILVTFIRKIKHFPKLKAALHIYFIGPSKITSPPLCGRKSVKVRICLISDPVRRTEMKIATWVVIQSTVQMHKEIGVLKILALETKNF